MESGRLTFNALVGARCGQSVAHKLGEGFYRTYGNQVRPTRLSSGGQTPGVSGVSGVLTVRTAAGGEAGGAIELELTGQSHAADEAHPPAPGCRA